MQELLSTEREYVKALGYVREHYFPELERSDVPQDLRGQKGSVFGNLEKLHDFHRHHFLSELENCVNEPFRVGRCFLRHVGDSIIHFHSRHCSDLPFGTAIVKLYIITSPPPKMISLVKTTTN